MEYTEIEYLLKIIKRRLILINQRLKKLELVTKGHNKYDEIRTQQEEKILALRLSRELRESLYKYKSPDQVHQSKRVYSSLEEKHKGLYIK